MFKRAVNAYFCYKFLRLLVTPWEKTPVFRLGIIDRNGNRLISWKDMTPEQRRYFTSFDRLVYNLKKMIAKVPGQKITSWALALTLIRENVPDKEYRRLMRILEEAPTSVAAQVDTSPATSKRIKKGSFKIAKRKKPLKL